VQRIGEQCHAVGMHRYQRFSYRKSTREKKCYPEPSFRLNVMVVMMAVSMVMAGTVGGSLQSCMAQ
jgi:hypothetical protein